MNKKDLVVAYAVQSVSYELFTPYKPGLVDKYNCGAHSDMNYFTFIDSISVLTKYFEKFYEYGESIKKIDKESFKGLRSVGINCEVDMLNTTLGINTHKGTIFCFAIILTVIGYIEANELGKSKDALALMIKKLCNGLCSDDFGSLEGKRELTHGELIYVKYGITGIRGESENGFPTVLNYALPYLESMLEIYDDKYGDSKLNAAEKQEDLSRIFLNTLLCIMSYADDTNILYRHDMDVLNKVKSDSKEALILGGSFTENGIEFIKSLDKEYTLKRISPGGSADLLSVTIFFQKYLYQ